MTVALTRDPIYLTLSEIKSRLQDLVKERAAKSADYDEAIQMAVDQIEEIATFAYTDDNVTINGTSCAIALPCAAILSYELYVRQGCPDCYEFMPSRLEFNQIHVDIPMAATGKLLVYGSNQYVEDQHTVATPVYDSTTGTWAIYLDGQPEIQPFGFIKIGPDVYLYYCKDGQQWQADAGIVPSDYMYTDEDYADTLPEESHGDPDFSEVADFRPTGVHTVLNVVVDVRKGRSDEIDPLKVLSGTLVSFPLCFDTRNHVNLLLYSAAAHLYVRLISSCSSQKDIERYTAMNDYYEKKATTQRANVRKVRRKKTVRRDANHFRTTSPLSARWSAPYDGRFA